MNPCVCAHSPGAVPHGRYAIRESTSKVKLFKNFKEKKAVKLNFAAEGVFGGALLGVRAGTFLCFYDWENGALVRRVDVAAKNVGVSAPPPFRMLRKMGRPIQRERDTGMGMGARVAPPCSLSSTSPLTYALPLSLSLSVTLPLSGGDTGLLVRGRGDVCDHVRQCVLCASVPSRRDAGQAGPRGRGGGHRGRL
jgi:hypothetical protein